MLSSVLVLASAAALAAGCNGEQAVRARDGGALSTGGSGADVGGMAGAATDTGGSVGAGGQVGSGGQGGPLAGHGGALGGMAGGGRGGMGGLGGGQAVGTTCMHGTDCVTGFCYDGVCCATDCVGACRTCNGATPGTCVPAASGTDPRDDCPSDPPESCGSMGTCNGLGTCQMYPSTQVCNSTPSCNATSSAVVANSMCDGAGHCKPGAETSCNGFLCSPATATCGTICGSDTACVQGGFCSASTCVAVPNIVANGDLETGTLTGWGPANGANPLMLSSKGMSGFAHGGTYSLYETSRTANFQGPGYALPTGLGKYKITAWGMQNQNPVLTGVLQIRLDCPDNASTSGSYVNVQDGTGFGISMPQGVWTQFTATVDTSDPKWPTPLCYPTGPGLVKAATLYLNQVDNPGDPVQFPDLYLDDVVVQVPDGHNLIGNPIFEAGLTAGWTATSGKLAISSTFFHGGAKSLGLTMRTGATAGIRYQLPTGAARYTVSFWAMQTGTMSHQLQLQPSYTCIPSSGAGISVNTTPSAAVQADPNTWVQVTQTFIMPPVDAPIGCVLSQASVTLQQADAGGACAGGECPDLYIDDTSIVIPVQ